MKVVNGESGAEKKLYVHYATPFKGLGEVYSRGGTLGYLVDKGG